MLIISFNLHQTEICLAPADEGPCRGIYNRFAFDRQQNRCVPFNYGKRFRLTTFLFAFGSKIYLFLLLFSRIHRWMSWKSK